MKHNEEVRKLFKRYLEGKANLEEKETLLRQLGSAKIDDEQFSDLMEEAWAKEPSQRANSDDVDAEFEAILTKIETKQQTKNQYFKVIKCVAAIVLVCSAGLGWYNIQKNQKKSVQPIQMLSRTTHQGEKIKIILTDGTVVYLNGSSTLKWPSRFVKGHYRAIHLEGEAFFDVKRDTLSPFMVYSGSIQTRVFGTSFNINAYPSDNIFSVAVRTGKVRVSENHQGVIKKLSWLTPGMKLDYNTQNRHYTIDTEDTNSWIENRFVFKDDNLLTMLEKLERYYKVRFIVKTPCLANKHRFNATFDKKSIKEIMEQIRMMSAQKIYYKITKDTLITIWREGCK